MADAVDVTQSGLGEPAVYAVAVTPSDDTDLANVSRALYVGGAGDVEVIMLGGRATVVFSAVPAGTILPIRVCRVKDGNTTATLILNLY